VRSLWRLRRKLRKGVFGSRLALRLVLLFALVAVLPGALVYAVSVQFLGKSIESWFDVRVDRALAGMTAMVRVETATQCAIYGVMVNGRWVMRLHHEVGTLTELNVTPWIRFGEENEICIVRRNGPDKGEIKSVRLEFHKAGEYP
jgi:hypothetical protein